MRDSSAITPVSLVLVSVQQSSLDWTQGDLLDRAANAAISDFHPLGDLLAALVDCQRLLNVQSWEASMSA